MTYRDRRLARAERLRGWAGKRHTDAAATLHSFDHYRGDIAFATQPGHIPERARMIRAEDRAFASISKADAMARRADEIERQAAGAIYSDDPDAIERLREKIAKLEATRDARKARNAAWRAEHRAELRTMTAYERDQAQPFPGYAITNMTGNIGRLRARLAGLERQEARRATPS